MRASVWPPGGSDWRDVGAAGGPLVAPALFEAIGGRMLYAAATAAISAGALIARSVP